METQIQTNKLENNTTSNQEHDGHGSDSSKWPHLCQDISESILRKLCLTDYLNFGLVCSSWGASLNSAIQTKKCHPYPQIPFLLICPKWIFSKLNPFIVDLNEETTLHPKRRFYPSDQIVLGAVDGWLIVLKCTETYSLLPLFFNPVSGQSCVLPSIMEGVNQLTIKKMVASSAPNNNNNNNNNDSVFVVCLADDRIIYCKTTDKSWSLIKTIGRYSFSDIVVIENLLYVLGNETGLDDIEVYNLNNIDPLTAPAPATARKLVVLDPKPQVHHDFDEQVHLAHDVVSGDLMLVVIRYVSGMRRFISLGASNYLPSVKEFRVMKIDRSSSDEDNEVRFVEVEDLVDRLVFFDRTNCRIISTVGVQMENVRRNCVYFAEGHGIKLFCLSDKSFSSYNISQSNCLALGPWNHCLWFTPNLW